jgi:CDP-diacylglycerol--serine O-phosphatidyltransferase
MTSRSRKVRLIKGEGESGHPLRRGVYLLPNLVTTASIFLGFYAILASTRGDFFSAAICIVVAHVCDGLDGRIARLTNTTSQFGIEYDSLADLVAFGVAPGVIVYYWALQPFGAWGWLAASLFVVCGALRLARFNVQAPTVEKTTFTGLPIPAAANMLAATVLLYEYFGIDTDASRHVVLPILVYSLALLMVSNFRYYSFKDINLRSRQPFSMLVGFVILAMLVIAEPQIMLFGGLLVYVGSGPVAWLVRRAGRRSSAVEQSRQRVSGDDPDAPGN